MTTLNSCKSELLSIIRELESIEEGVRNSFTGIGQDYCADSLDAVIRKYQNVLYRLEQVDTNRLADFINGEG